jgi:hypothetical protein
MGDAEWEPLPEGLSAESLCASPGCWVAAHKGRRQERDDLLSAIPSRIHEREGLVPENNGVDRVCQALACS